MNHTKGGSRTSLIVGLGLLAAFLAAALFPQLLAPYPPKEMFAPWQGLSPAHLLGTNDMGYDIHSELIFAAASTLTVGTLSAVLSLTLGTALGIVGGFGRGLAASAADLCADVFILIPLLPAAVVLSSFGEPGTGKLILVIGLLGWSGTARAVRAGAAVLRGSDFIHSLTILGVPRRRIMLRHVLPNLSELILSRFVMSAASCIMTEATLSFLGLGDPTRVTWGGMISLAYKRGGFARGAVNWFLAPGLCITLLALAFYFVSRFFENRADRVFGVPEPDGG